jgi:hypothetical protein
MCLNRAVRLQESSLAHSKVIGVVAKESEYPEVREFFELFKTPWEFYNSEHDYDVVLCACQKKIETSASLLIVYGAEDADVATVATNPTKNTQVAVRTYKGDRIPLYDACSAVPGNGLVLLRFEESGKRAALEQKVNGQRVVKVGYNLFSEIRYLLAKGQPLSEARVPTLELHISFLRDLIIRGSIPVLEIPPVPAGYKFIACLTHDVDHPALRNHFFDHTMFGFLYRATLGSLVDLFRGRKSLKQLVSNLAAAFSLPLVYLGWIRDPWAQFERYVGIEQGASSTFFVIPTKGNEGVPLRDKSAQKRAAKYDMADMRDKLRSLQEAGCELGVHGIDAWKNSTAGRRELEKLKSVTRNDELGVRMHWLYFDEKSPAALDQAGFSYDSTCGYNQTVGYRAGTLQVFKPREAQRLLELPLHVMDTALFFGRYSNFSPRQAEATVAQLMDHAARFGGVVTFNWHDRSIAPERSWDRIYVGFLNELRSRGAWVTNAGQAVAWFRKRRCAEIDESAVQSGKGKDSCASADGLPGLSLHIHQNASTAPAADPIQVESVMCSF